MSAYGLFEKLCRFLYLMTCILYSHADLDVCIVNKGERIEQGGEFSHKSALGESLRVASFQGECICSGGAFLSSLCSLLFYRSR